MNRLIAIAALLTFAAVADAGCAVVHRAAVVKQQVVVAPVVQALAVAAPAYGAGFSPYQQTDPELLRQLLEEIRAMRAELRAALQQGQSQPPADAAALAANACAKCHQDGTKEVEQNGFVMFEKDGKPSVLSLEHRNRIKRRTENASMPPPKSINRPLSDAERKSLVEFFTKPKE